MCPPLSNYAIVGACDRHPDAMTKPGHHPPSSLFSTSFPPSFGDAVFANARPVRLAAGKVLFLTGDPGDGCYRVEQGLLKVSMVAVSGAERILAIVGPGGIVGELSTIDGLARSASVSTLRD